MVNSMKIQEISEYVNVSLLLKIASVLMIRYLVGMKVGHMVLKSQNLVPQGNGRTRLESSTSHNNTPNFEYHNVITSDNIILDTVEINPSFKLLNVPHVIKFNGNSMTYHDRLPEMIEAANDMGVVMVAFDYPNVGHSGSIRLYSQQPLVNAGIAQVQRLLDRGVHPNKITLDGSSLGGAIATLVADYFYHKRQSIQLHLINDRSFSSVTNVISSMLGTQKLNFFIKPTLLLVGWEINAARAFKRLPENNKMVLFSKHDTTINYGIASLYKEVKHVISDKQVYEIANGHTMDYVHTAQRKLLLNELNEAATERIKKFVLRKID